MTCSFPAWIRIANVQQSGRDRRISYSIPLAQSVHYARCNSGTFAYNKIFEQTEHQDEVHGVRTRSWCAYSFSSKLHNKH